MRAAIIGCGTIAEVHAAVLHQMNNVTLTAFADIVPERAQDFQKRYGGAVYQSLEDMLEHENIDVLHICTPHYLHVPMIIYAVTHHVHAFSEKPPVISRDQLKRLFALQASQQYGFCFQNRYNASIFLARQMLASETAGKILGARGIVTWARDASYYTESNWRGKWETEGGGALINQSVHTMDLLVYLLGKPLEVEATMQNHHLKHVIEVEDTVEAFIRFAGTNALFYASTAYVENLPPLIEISCENLRIRIEDQSLTYYWKDGTVEVPAIAEQKNLGKNYWGSGHKGCIENFYQCIQANLPFPQNLAGTMDTINLMLGTYESAKTGLPVSLEHY